MNYGFIKTAVMTPNLRLADCSYNAKQMIDQLKQADREGVRLAVLPELCITGYTCGDLFFQNALLDAALLALCDIAKATAELSLVAVVGTPIRLQNNLYNCAAVICGGKILGLVPKTNLPNYSEFYEKRYFSPAPDSISSMEIDGQTVPFGKNLLFYCLELPELVIGAEICEDLWVADPPSLQHAKAGATVIVNLSASDETVGKADYRRSLVSLQSAKLVCGYLYADAGVGESTTDMVFSGHNLIAENGTILAQSLPFGDGFAISELDVQRLARERARLHLFTDGQPEDYLQIPFSLPVMETKLTRPVSTLPFIPEEETNRAARCEEILSIQAAGLSHRMKCAGAKTAVVGISGGLDSCLALLVSVRAADLLGLPHTDVIAVTMPCFGTTKRTRGNAEILAQELGVTLREVNISQSVLRHFEDIGHDPQKADVVFENAQARERTQVLMDISNQASGLVVGTGDLSELALGWATYNGDHMSMYGVNASVPKTLIRHLVRHVADKTENTALKNVLLDILDTPVSPELLPAADGEISQVTEDIVGPYELHDFFLYYAVRWGFSPKKVLHLAVYAFNGVYTASFILKWLKTFYRRFFAQQFKRSCLPDGPKVGSVSLSPRGDWRMPSDASAAVWLKQLDE